ncbi:MAG: hypothetical protein JWN86_1592 [Planctomycetota bacterium]|nr:hypothetical protein [Planctomycetota bacterium]
MNRSQCGMVLLSLAALHSTAHGQASERATTVDAAKGKWLPVLQKHATEYVIAVTEPSGKKTTKLRPDPLMRWSQPVRGGEDGVICLWVEAGRPVTVMSFFTLKAGDGKRWIVHEHQSLSPRPLEASWQGREMWHTATPGVVFAPVPDAPAPADSAPARSRQMQQILSDFSANTIDNKKVSWPLRALPKPLYRYENTGSEVLDGGLFTLAQGTDPEALILLEARIDGKQTRWYYGAARLTDLNLRVRFKDREILSVPYTVGRSDEPYQTFIVINKASDRPEDFVRP